MNLLKGTELLSSAKLVNASDEVSVLQGFHNIDLIRVTWDIDRYRPTPLFAEELGPKAELVCPIQKRSSSSSHRALREAPLSTKIKMNQNKHARSSIPMASARRIKPTMQPLVVYVIALVLALP
jgi:hypothetical protein